MRIQHADEWQRRISESFFPLALSAAPDGFHATIRTTDLPRGMRISEVHVGRTQVRRTERQVRTQPSDHVLALFQYEGHAIVRQADREVHLEGGSATIADPTEPYDVTMTGDSHQMVFLVPTAALRAAGADISVIRTRLLPGTSLSVRSLSALASSLVAADVDPAEAEGIAAAAFDLFRGALNSVGALEAPTRSLTHEAQLRVIKDFIEANLGDQELDLELIARAHHVSVRHLADLFAPETPGAYIRRARLERVYRDLTDPAFATMTAQQVSGRWGFASYSTMLRAFRREFDASPADVRAVGLPGSRKVP
ncbi:helix-turn-helix domain-containing protein [Agromyces tropicus]|uniref:Helix-turn-helix domain-containing protein n=2 Tax=Agromyces tropicus TaxID=555371 RepID=A0ABN2U0Q2_9MICO